jgi:hypothetical protein
MKEQLVSYETAQLAKKYGFNEKIKKIYNGRKEIINQTDLSIRINSRLNLYQYLAPTQSILQKWLRDKNIIIDIQLDQTSYPKYCFNIYKYKEFGNWDKINNPEWGLYSTYEKALEDALVLGLQNVY